ncbi:MAG TPA: hypothetical protein VI365_27130 [Trebonia sp.]
MSAGLAREAWEAKTRFFGRPRAARVEAAGLPARVLGDGQARTGEGLA